MLSETLSRTNYLVLPILSLVLFAGIFGLMGLWIFRRGAKKTYLDRSMIVFDDGTQESHRGEA